MTAPEVMECEWGCHEDVADAYHQGRADERAEAWRVAAKRRNEARRYYVAWMSARMRAAALRREVTP